MTNRTRYTPKSAKARRVARGATCVEFTATAPELAIVREIVKRAKRVGLLRVIGGNAMDLEMDLVAVHSNGCPLDFAKLRAFDAFDFTHDICGIRRHIDRVTGHLADSFFPRCALTSTAVEITDAGRRALAEPLPCPFCGATPMLAPSMNAPFGGVLIFCPSDECHAAPAIRGRTDGEALERWNRRAES